MKKAVARVGDSGSHGGSIVAGASRIFINGKPVARVGDIYDCPEHGPNPIISGANSVYGQGQLVAHVGSKTACGATINSGSPNVFIEGMRHQDETSSFPGYLTPEIGNRYFIVVDEEDEPVSDVEYIITDEDGTEYMGITDENGHTRTIFGNVGETLRIKVFAPE